MNVSITRGSLAVVCIGMLVSGCWLLYVDRHFYSHCRIGLNLDWSIWKPIDYENLTKWRANTTLTWTGFSQLCSTVDSYMSSPDRAVLGVHEDGTLVSHCFPVNGDDVDVTECCRQSCPLPNPSHVDFNGARHRRIVWRLKHDPHRGRLDVQCCRRDRCITVAYSLALANSTDPYLIINGASGHLQTAKHTLLLFVYKP